MSRTVLIPIAILALLALGLWAGGILDAPTAPEAPSVGGSRTSAGAGGEREAPADWSQGLFGRAMGPNGPLVDARIVLRRDLAPHPAQALLGRVIWKGRTDGQGGFRINLPRELIAGVLEARHPGFAVSRKTAFDALELDRPEIDLHLAPGLQASGSVSVPDGVSLADATVRIRDERLGAIDPAWSLEAEVPVQDGGVWIAPNLTSGSKRIEVVAEGLVTSRTTFLLQVGNTRVPEIGLQGEALAISGRLLWDGSDEGAGDVLVLASEVGAAPGSVIHHTRTTSDGRFTVRGLGRGLYSLQARLASGIPGATIEAVAGSADVTLTTRRPLHLSGRVTDRATGAPITSYLLRVVQDPRGTRVTDDLCLVASADGAFDLPATTAYRFPHLVIEAPGRPRFVSEPLTPDADGRISGLEFALGEGAVVEGRLVASTSLPAEGVSLFLEPKIARPASGSILAGVTSAMARGRLAAPIETRADAEGRFRMKGIEAGTWVLRTLGPGLCLAPRTIEVGPDASVDLGDLALQQAGSLEILARTSNGQPDSRATFTVTHRDLPELSAVVQTDGKGVATIEGLLPGPYVIRALQREGVSALLGALTGSSAATTIEVRAGERARLDGV